MMRFPFLFISRNYNYPSLSNSTEGFQISIILYPSKYYFNLLYVHLLAIENSANWNF